MIRRLITAVQVAWLRWCLDSSDSYMRSCERIGIADTESMREWRKQAEAMRCRIAILEN